MVFHPVLLIIEILIVLAYILGLVFFLDFLYFIVIYIFIGFFIFLGFRYLILSTSSRGFRYRRDIIGYILMMGGPFLFVISFYLEVIIIYIGSFFFFSRAFYELNLWVKLIRLGDGYADDEEMYDLSTGWEYELQGEGPSGPLREEERKDKDEDDEEKVLDISNVLKSDEVVE